MTQNKNKHLHHIPVLMQPVLRYLDPKPGESYLDLTAGYGGHASAIFAHTKAPHKATLVDRDQMAIGELVQIFGGTVELMHRDFYSAAKELLAEGRQYDVILADLGVSSPHLDTASRGFAFARVGPLDMRMDTSQTLTAEQIVNTYDAPELIRVLKEFGEEPKAKRIAELIIENRPIQTTTELAKIVAKAYPGHSRVHPATRAFQALRIAVNDELELLKHSLPLWFQLLAPGGRIGIISFHSLEDRIVKDALKEAAGERYDAELRLITKRPILGDQHEIVSNPRARSAKFRAAVKIKTNEREAHANSG